MIHFISFLEDDEMNQMILQTQDSIFGFLRSLNHCERTVKIAGFVLCNINIESGEWFPTCGQAVALTLRQGPCLKVPQREEHTANPCHYFYLTSCTYYMAHHRFVTVSFI